MREVRRCRIAAVVAYKLDRLGRSLPHLAQLVGEIASHGVALVIPAQGRDTSASNPANQLQLNILMAVAEFEREIIRSRVNAGLKAARARGARLGRPSTLLKHRARARELLAVGNSISHVVPAEEIHTRAREAVNICLQRPGRYGPPVFPTP